MPLDDYIKLSELVKNIFESLAVLGGALALIKWISERHDRATDVLFKLEEKFVSLPLQRAKEIVEYDSKFDKVKGLLVDLAIPDPEHPGASTRIYQQERGIKDLDDLLRFYVFLLGVKKAKQVPISALSASYRYYLIHYYSRRRRELRIYINTFWPTLMRWLASDRKWWKRLTLQKFYDPEFFGFDFGRKISCDDLSKRLKRKVLVLTGSGISAESDIPTFRDPGGYWRNYDPKELAYKKAFLKDPHRVWEFYLERRQAIAHARSNLAHQIVAKIAEHAREFLLITQNVDDLHERENLLPESKIVHIHGKINVNRCEKCAYSDQNSVSLQQLPHCPIHPEEILRPGVVWFDEELDPKDTARVEEFLNSGPCDLVLVVGTSATFSYIVNWSLRATGANGFLIEINPDETRMSAATDQSIRATAVEAMQKRIEPLLK